MSTHIDKSGRRLRLKLRTQRPSGGILPSGEESSQSGSTQAQRSTVTITPTDRLYKLPGGAFTFNEVSGQEPITAHPLFTVDGSPTDIQNAGASLNGLLVDYCNRPSTTASDVFTRLGDLENIKRGPKFVLGQRERPSMSSAMRFMTDDSALTIGVGPRPDGGIQVFTNQQRLSPNWHMNEDTRERLRGVRATELCGSTNSAQVKECISDFLDPAHQVGSHSQRIVGLSVEECTELARDPVLFPRLDPKEYSCRPPQDAYKDTETSSYLDLPYKDPSRRRPQIQQPQLPASEFFPSKLETIRASRLQMQPGSIGVCERPVVSRSFNINGQSRAKPGWHKDMDTETAAKANPFLQFNCNPTTGLDEGSQEVDELNRYCQDDHSIEEFRRKVNEVVARSRTLQVVEFQPPTSPTIDSILSETPTFAFKPNTRKNGCGLTTSIYANKAAQVALENDACGYFLNRIQSTVYDMQTPWGISDSDTMILERLIRDREYKSAPGISVVKLDQSDYSSIKEFYPNEMREIAVEELSPF